MNVIADVLGGIASGLGTFVPEFFKALLNGVIELLFVTTTTGSGETAVTAISGLSPVGALGIVFIVIGMTARFLPTILGFVRLRVSGWRKRRTTKKAA